MLSQKIYKPFGLEGYANNLKAEFDAQPLGVKIKWWRGMLSRELMLWLSGQKFLQQKHYDLKNKPRILWIYDGLSMGDCIMDLSQRSTLANYTKLEACITRAPAALFQGDSAFKHIYQRLEDCSGGYDFILLNNISSSALRAKRRFFPKTAFATMLDHQQGEMYDRVTYTSLRLQQLFRLPNGLRVTRPILPKPNLVELNHRICVPLGGADMRRLYLSWPEVLERIVQIWPVHFKKPRFVLVGSGTSAQGVLNNFRQDFLYEYCDQVIDAMQIQKLRDTVAECEFFLGVDGGVMHVAEALNKKGLALFVLIRPEWRLQKNTRLRSFYVDSLGDLNSKFVAEEFIKLIIE